MQLCKCSNLLISLEMSSCDVVVSAALHLTEPRWRGGKPNGSCVGVRVHRYAPAVAPLLASLLEAGALSLAGGGAQSARCQRHLPARAALPWQSAGHTTQRFVRLCLYHL